MSGTVQTRGGMLVGLAVLAVIGFELRTVGGMMLGIDIPAAPYFVGLLVALALIGLYFEVSRSRSARGQESD